MTDNPLKRLFHSYRAELQSYLTRRLRDPEPVADLTQEAFLRYAEHPSAMAGEIRNNRSYLYRTAHNLAVDHIRKSARDQTDMPSDTVMATLPDDHPGQEIQTADRQSLCHLGAVLDELPERTRQIVIRDRAVAARRVSGVFDTGDIDSAVARIAEALDLRQMSLPPFVTLLY